VRSGEVDAALFIPTGFLGDLTTLGQNATLALVVDESDPVRAGVARNAVEGAMDAFVKTVVQKKIDDVLQLLNLTVQGGSTRFAFVDVQVLGLDAARARLVEVRQTVDPKAPEYQKLTDVIGFLDFTRGVLSNSERYLHSTALPLHVVSRGLSAAPTRLVSVALPGALVLGLFWTGGVASALLAARDRETGAFRRLAAAPRLRLLAPASRTIAALLAALIPAALVLGLGVLVLGARVVDPLATLGVLLLGALAASALGALAAALARATSGAALLVVLALLPMVLLGGLFYPVSYMPLPAQLVARALPLTSATDALRGAMLRGSPLDELALPVAGLVAFAALATGLTLLVGRRDD
jgi:ABC-type multidrug transport system permease subunit